MTARYTDAEKAAAKRIGYAPVLVGEPPSKTWLSDFRRLILGEMRSAARYYRNRSARTLVQAARKAAEFDRLCARMMADAADARTVANAVAREQRKAARS